MTYTINGKEYKKGKDYLITFDMSSPDLIDNYTESDPIKVRLCHYEDGVAMLKDYAGTSPYHPYFLLSVDANKLKILEWCK